MDLKHFETLNAINVNDHTEERDGLTYLSWAWAWAEVKKAYPDATYTIKRFDNKPYLFDEKLGYMVFTEMTIENHTHEMWLPVMNGAKKAMKNEPYTYEVKKYEWDNQKRKNVWTGEYEDKVVEAATMFDINTAIMRCLVKNIAMFGLGLYIYAGEDLPEGAENTQPEKVEQKTTSKTTETHPIIKHSTTTIIDTSKFTCSKCGKEIEKKVKDYSEKYYGKALCRDCQKQATKATETPKVVIAENPQNDDLPF